MNKRKLQKQSDEWLEAYQEEVKKNSELVRESKEKDNKIMAYENGPRLSYKCPHCESPLDGPQPKPIWDTVIHWSGPILSNHRIQWSNGFTVHDCGCCGAVVRSTVVDKNIVIETLHKPSKQWLADQKKDEL